MSCNQKTWILGIETSCDETAIGILDTENRRFSFEKVLTQLPAHAPFGGVVPNLASKLHLDHTADILTDLSTQYPNWREKVCCVAATTKPGLVTSLLVGATVGQSIAKSLNVNFIPIDHCEAHLYSSLLTESDEGPENLDHVSFPVCALIISGGHTLWIELDKNMESTCFGTTLDDALGECFDKVGKLLGLPYPGGPHVEEWSTREPIDPVDLPFTLSVPMPDGTDFSFSGLKTAVRYGVEKASMPMTEDFKISVSKHFHDVIERLLVKKVQTCLRSRSPNEIWLSGGVSANKKIRHLIEEIGNKNDVLIRIVPRKYAGDNASMIAYLAYLKYKGYSCRNSDEPEVSPYSVFSAPSSR